jgi:putative membrane protein
MTGKLRKLLFQIIAGIIAIWLASQLVNGVELETAKTLYLAGLFLGLINFFIKPILKLITLPLRIITFGFFTLVINIGIVWSIKIIFPHLIIDGLVPLFWTTITVWIISSIAHRL